MPGRAESHLSGHSGGSGRLLRTMSSIWSAVERLLPGVSRPVRYVGLEDGVVRKPWSPEMVRWLFAYPDSYEIGLPNQGLQILYEIVNERADALAERAYAPWVDMEVAMRRGGVPWFSLESHRPAADFDAIGFNLSAELTYTNVLNLLDLAGLPVRQVARGPEHPLVVAGGHAAFNPEPLASFVDAFVLGDGEEVIGELTDVLALHRRADRLWRDESLLLDLAQIDGVYVPSLYEQRYRGQRLLGTWPRMSGVPERVGKRTVADLAEWPYPRRQLVPVTEVVHDRLSVEVFRGCTRGCRFCQAGMITRPVRERPARQIEEMVTTGLRRTGYDEVSLTSLSTADLSGIDGVVRSVLDADCAHRASVSLPSLRVDAFTVSLAAEIQRVRRGGLTFAPEAGTWRLRQVINKLISDEDLYGALEAAFSQGWRRAKLYFLTGLPTETDDDTLGIAALAREAVARGRRAAGRPVSVTVSVGGFVPKPQTPFQWSAQAAVNELTRRIGLLRTASERDRSVVLRWHDPRATLVEGMLSRGDRRMGDVVEHVWRRGGTFQEWSERFDVELWLSGMAEAGLSIDEHVLRERSGDEPLPWDHLSAGLHRDFLWGEWQAALAAAGTPDCRWTPCYDCGVCTGSGLEHVVASSTPPAGGSQGTGAPVSTPVRIAERGGSRRVRVTLG
jgi:radical SAM family uncharacterized protein